MWVSVSRFQLMTRAILHRPELTDGNPQKRDRNPDPGKPLIETLIVYTPLGAAGVQ
jgi:hypothetical protein